MHSIFADYEEMNTLETKALDTPKQSNNLLSTQNELFNLLGNLKSNKQRLEKVEESLDNLNSTFLSKQAELDLKYTNQLQNFEKQQQSDLDCCNEEILAKNKRELEQLEIDNKSCLLSLEQTFSQKKANLLRDKEHLLQPLRNITPKLEVIEQTLKKLDIKVTHLEDSDYPTFKDERAIEKFNYKLDDILKLQNIRNISIKHLSPHTKYLLYPYKFVSSYIPREYLPLYVIVCIVASGYFLLHNPMWLIGLTGGITLSTVYTCIKFSIIRKEYTLFKQLYNHNKEIENEIIKTIEQTYLEDLLVELENKKTQLNKLYLKNKNILSAPILQKLDYSLIENHKASQKELHINQTNELRDLQYQQQIELQNESEDLNLKIQQDYTNYQVTLQNLSDLLLTPKEGVVPLQQIYYGDLINEEYPELTEPNFNLNLTCSTCIYYDTSQLKNLTNWLQYSILQNWLSLSPKLFQVKILDSNTLAEPFTTIHADNSEIIEFITTSQGITDFIDNLYNELQQRIITYSKTHNNVIDYNKSMAQKSAKPIPYTFVVNLHVTPQLLLTPRYITLIKQCKDAGIFLVNCVDTKLLDASNDTKKGQAEQIDMVCMEHNNFLTFNGNVIIDENEVNIPVRLQTKSFLLNKTKLVVDRVEALKTAELPFIDFINKVRKLPRLAIKDGISAFLGYKDGDLSDIFEVKFNNNQAHFLLVGTNGTGKSVILDILIMAISLIYTPEEVNFVLPDFKGTGFYKYSYPNNNPTPIPHVRATTSTKNGFYIQSLLNAVKREVETRNDLFNLVGVENYKEFKELPPQHIMDILTSPTPSEQLKAFRSTKAGRELLKLVLQNGKYPVLPRVFFIIDEFAEMFQIDEYLSGEFKSLIASLAKIARSAGVHLGFASQNMSGTVSDDVIDQLPIRLVAKVPSELSRQIIKNSEASKIVVGECIHNNNVELGEKANTLLRVPFRTDNEFTNYVKEVRDLHCPRGWDFPPNNYDEKLLHPMVDFRKRIKSYSREIINTTNNSLYLLGEPVVYSARPVPEYFTTSYSPRGNLLIVDNQLHTINSMSSQIYEQLLLKKDTLDLFTFTSQEDLLRDYPDIHTITTLNPPFVYADGIVNDLVTPMKSVGTTYSHRLKKFQEDNSVVKTFKPVYYFIQGLETFYGVGLPPTTNAQIHAYDTLLEHIVEYNTLKIYFIFTSLSVKPISKLMNSIQNIICLGATELDVSYLPEVVQKNYKFKSNNFGIYADTATGVTKMFKVYQNYEQVEDVGLDFAF